MQLSEDDKCLLLKKIYFKKYNYNNLKATLEKNCDDDTLYNISQANQLVKIFAKKWIFYKNDKIDSKSLFTTQLVNQFSKIIHSKSIPNELAALHLQFIKLGIKKGYFSDTKLANMTIYVLQNYFKQKIKDNRIKNKIEVLLNWDKDIGQKWLLSYVSTKEIFEHNNLLSDNTKVVKSKREILKEIIKDYYKNEFELTREPKLKNNKKYLVVWGNILLNYKEKWRTIKKTLPVMFISYNLDEATFDVKRLLIMDTKIKKYLGSSFPKNYDSFDDMYQKLKDSLYAPLVVDDWSKSSNENISVCKKVKLRYKNLSCKNDKIILSAQDLWINDSNLRAFVELNNDLKATKIWYLNQKSYIDTKNILKEKIYFSSKELEKLSNIANSSFQKLDKKTVLSAKNILVNLF